MNGFLCFKPLFYFRIFKSVNLFKKFFSDKTSNGITKDVRKPIVKNNSHVSEWKRSFAEFDFWKMNKYDAYFRMKISFFLLEF